MASHTTQVEAHLTWMGCIGQKDFVLLNKNEFTTSVYKQLRREKTHPIQASQCSGHKYCWYNIPVIGMELMSYFELRCVTSPITQGVRLPEIQLNVCDVFPLISDIKQ